MLRGESADSEILFTGTDMAFSSPGCCFLSVWGLSGAPASSRGRILITSRAPAMGQYRTQAHRQLRVM